MDVICKLGEYSNPSKGEVNIESHLGDHNMVEIVIDGKRYVVCAEEVISAVKRVKLNVMGT